MNQVDETVLREVLRARSDILVPPVPVDHLLEDGRAVLRRRRNRLVAGVGLAAATVLVGAVLVVQPDDARSLDPVDRTPAPTQRSLLLRDLRQGALPALPFAEKGTLYVNGGTVELPTRGLVLAVGGDTIASWTAPATEGEPAPVDLLDPTTGQAVRRIAEDGGRPKVSADGGFVAWEDDDPDGTARVRLWDVEGEAELDPVPFPFTPTCCDNPFVLLGVDGDGAVYGRGGSSTWIAPRGEQPRLVEGLGGAYDASIAEVGAHRLVVVDGITSRVGHVDGTGFREEVEVSGSGATLSPDESAVAYADGAAVRIRELDADDETEVKLPTDVVANGQLTWEASGALLVQVQTRTGETGADAWLRCSAQTGTCELAATFHNELPTLPSR